MAHYFIFPEADTTLYSHPDRTLMNSGYDEVLELVQEPGSTTPYNYPSRILIKFPNENISKALDLIGHEDWMKKFPKIQHTASVNLQLTVANAKNLASVHLLQAYAVSQSWDEGTGKFLNQPTGSNGTSWEFRDNSITQTQWVSSSCVDCFGHSSVTGGVHGGTGSLDSTTDGVEISDFVMRGGGTYYTGSAFKATQQFLPGDDLDTNFDVKRIVQFWSASINNGGTYAMASLDGEFEKYLVGIPNYGFLIKAVNSIESNLSSSFGEIQYFSTDTHTIYPPKLTFKWDDHVYGPEIPPTIFNSSHNLHLSIYNNKEQYNQNDIATFRLHIREKYPERNFTNTSNYLNAGIFGDGEAYYSIRDAHSERVIIPFDNYTQLSADIKGMYFKLHMAGLQPERYYRILFKHQESDKGTITYSTIYDDDYYFKVVR